MKKLDILLLGKYVKKKTHKSSIYNFLKNMLGEEYLKITQGINFKNVEKKKKKPRKRTLLFK